MLRLIIDLFAGYVFYQVIKFMALNLYLPAVKEVISIIFGNKKVAQ